MMMGTKGKRKNIYLKMRGYEIASGKSIVDDFDYAICHSELMYWMCGADYINKTRLSAFAWSKSKGNQFVLKDMLTGYNEYSLLPGLGDSQDAYLKALFVLSEFIADNDVYECYLNTFFKKYDNQDMLVRESKRGSLNDEYTKVRDLSVTKMNRLAMFES